MTTSIPDNCWPSPAELLLLTAGLSSPATAGDVIRMLASRAAEKRLKLDLSVDSAVPQFVLGDPARLILRIRHG